MTPAGTAFRLELRPSRLLAGALLLAHGLAVAAAWASLGGWPRILLAAAILASLIVTLSRALLLARQPSALELKEDGGGSWRDRRGGWHECRLGKRHFVTPFLVVVELESGFRGLKWVLLLADSAAPDEFRRLRVWLRWRQPPERAEPE